MFTRKIPSSGEVLPAIGLGTWKTFDVAASGYANLNDVLNIIEAGGGRLIDSSPMYGRAEEAIGNITHKRPGGDDFFYATKVWTTGARAGKEQIASSYQLMKRSVMDLIQIHNLADWQTHLPYLRALKSEGKLRYIGITHYLDNSHEELATIIKKEPVDFVQFNYSILSRNAEKQLLPLCADKGVATIINRPFGEGSLFKKVAHKPLPEWCKQLAIDNWGAFFLKFIIVHPAVTCVIPATCDVVHARQNLQAGKGSLPDDATLKRMVAYMNAQ